MSFRFFLTIIFLSTPLFFPIKSFAIVCNNASTELCGGFEVGTSCMGGVCAQKTANSDECFCQPSQGPSTVTCSSTSTTIFCQNVSAGSRCTNGGTCTVIANTSNQCECTPPSPTPTATPSPTTPPPTITCHSTNSKNLCNNFPVGTNCLDSNGQRGQCEIEIPTVNNCYCKTTIITPTPSLSNSPPLTQTPTPTSNPTNTPPLTPTPSPLSEKAVKCDLLNASYPPNTECYSAAGWIPAAIQDYDLSCIPAPEVTYTSTYTGPRPPWVPVQVSSDFSEARLGAYGPDANTINTSSPDYLAKNYLYNAIFDKPNYSDPNTSREMYRAYWRLLSAYDQANLKSMYLNKAFIGLTSNLSYTYVKNGEYKKTDSRSLYAKLLTHTSIINLLPNVGCLVKQPVCKDFAEVYNDLSNEIVYRDLKEEYDALIPFDWNDIRSYILTKGVNSTVTKENIPYVGAILDGLTNNYGMLNLMSPSWVDNSVRFTPQLPVHPLTNINDFMIGPLNLTGWVQGVGDIANPENVVITLAKIRAVIESKKMCVPPPQSKGISSPKTYPDGDASVNQTIWISNLRETATNTFDELIPSNTELDLTQYCTDGYYHYDKSSNLYCQHQIVTVYGSGRGDSLLVLNNPKMTDVDTAIAGNDKKPGLVKMLVPNFVKLPEKIAISAPNTTHSTDTSGATVTNPSSPIYRQSNLAQDTMAEFQNCWTLPSSMQDSPQCKQNIQYSTGGQCKLSKIPLPDLKCKKNSFEKYLGTVDTPFRMAVPNVSPEVEAVYAEAERQTGVSCVILAGIHYREGSNNSCQSLISGLPIGTPEPDQNGAVYDTLLDSAIAAANEFKSKGGNQPGFENVIEALSNYNGGGNANCKSGDTDKIYGHCPPDFIGEDDPYAISWLDLKHSNMVLRCPSDGVCNGTGPFNQPGAYTVSLSYYLSLP